MRMWRALRCSRMYNRQVMRKLLRGVVIVLLALTVLQMADWMLSSDGRPPIIACLIVLGLVWLSWKSASKASVREIPKDFDSDGGIDWQEEGVNGQVYQRSGQWVLMVPDIAVYETDELCARLTDAGVRFRLEGSSRNPEYSHWGVVVCSLECVFGCRSGMWRRRSQSSINY